MQGPPTIEYACVHACVLSCPVFGEYRLIDFSLGSESFGKGEIDWAHSSRRVQAFKLSFFETFVSDWQAVCHVVLDLQGVRGTITHKFTAKLILD